MNIVLPFAAVAHQQVPSVGFNNNFTEVATKFNAYAVQTDVAKVINVAHTFTVAQNLAGATISGDLLFTDGLYDIGKVGATRPRDGFFSRNMTLGGALDVGAGTTLRGDLLFLADASFDIGKVGATRPRDGFFSRNVTLGAALVVGTSLVVGAGFTLTTGDLAVTAGRIVLGAAASKIVPGVTSVSLRNNADTADNVLVSDIGAVTVRSSVTTSTGTVTMSNGSPFVSAFNLLPIASDPSAPNNGDVWITTAGLFKARLNGATKTVLIQNPGSGYAAMTNTVNRATVYDTTTITLPQLASRVKAIQDDLMTQNILSV